MRENYCNSLINSVCMNTSMMTSAWDLAVPFRYFYSSSDRLHTSVQLYSDTIRQSILTCLVTRHCPCYRSFFDQKNLKCLLLSSNILDVDVTQNKARFWTVLSQQLSQAFDWGLPVSPFNFCLTTEWTSAVSLETDS